MDSGRSSQLSPSYWQSSSSSSTPWQGGFCTDSITLKLSKAFDRVNLERLLIKLHHIGFDSNLIRWMRSLLTGQTQKGCINGAASNMCKVTSGMPQGSFLSPSLHYLHKLHWSGFIPRNQHQAICKWFFPLPPYNLLRRSTNPAEGHWSPHGVRFRMEFNPRKCYATHFMTPHQKGNMCAVPYHMGDMRECLTVPILMWH